MATVDKQEVVTMQELLVSSLATADAVAKLLIEKGVISQAEFMQKLSAERAGYQEQSETISDGVHSLSYSPYMSAKASLISRDIASASSGLTSP